jgi:hypothetical protein
LGDRIVSAVDLFQQIHYDSLQVQFPGVYSGIALFIVKTLSCQFKRNGNK